MSAYGVTTEVDAVLSVWIAAFDAANLSAVQPLCRPDVIVHAPNPGIGAPRGLDRIVLLLQMYRVGFPDGRFALEHAGREGSIVSCGWSARGVNSGPFLQFPASQREVVLRGTCRLRYADGLVAEVWFDFGLYDVYEQLDALLPAPGRMLPPAEAITRRAYDAWVEALIGGPKDFEGVFSPALVVHANCFGMDVVETGWGALDRVLALAQATIAGIDVSRRESTGQGRTATYRARLTSLAGGGLPWWAFDCMLRAEGDRVVEIWIRMERRHESLD